MVVFNLNVTMDDEFDELLSFSQSQAVQYEDKKPISTVCCGVDMFKSEESMLTCPVCGFNKPIVGDQGETMGINGNTSYSIVNCGRVIRYNHSIGVNQNKHHGLMRELGLRAAKSDINMPRDIIRKAVKAFRAAQDTSSPLRANVKNSTIAAFLYEECLNSGKFITPTAIARFVGLPVDGIARGQKKMHALDLEKGITTKRHVDKYHSGIKQYVNMLDILESAELIKIVTRIYKKCMFLGIVMDCTVNSRITSILYYILEHNHADFTKQDFEQMFKVKLTVMNGHINRLRMFTNILAENQTITRRAMTVYEKLISIKIS